MNVNDDKLPLFECEPEISRSQKMDEERGGKCFERVALAFVVTITLLTLFCSWRNTMQFSMMQREEDTKAKSPFNPPPFLERAKTARYIVHYMDWTVIATMSSRFSGTPAGTPMSFADGPTNNSTGVPYIYVSAVDPNVRDLLKNPNATFIFSEAQTDYCTRNDFDPEDPRCARLFLNGKVVKVSSDEIPFAKEALFSRHPEMKSWPSSHQFFFAKLNINRISILDTFGGRLDVSLKDYFSAQN